MSLEEEMKMETSVHNRVVTMVRIGLLAALSVLLAGLVQFPIIPAYNFLKYDPADVFLLIGGFTFGPAWGIGLVAVTAMLQELIFGGNGGPIGVLMHFLASGTLVLVSSFLYRRDKTRAHAIWALLFGALSMVIVTVPLNLLLTPIYMGVSRQEVLGIILPAILPFNAIKAFGNALLTFILYKRVKYLLRF
jgi:riboflavin transporter FmnP